MGPSLYILCYPSIWCMLLLINYFRDMTIENMCQSEGMTELDTLQIKANSVVDESLESTRRMIAMCEEVSQGYHR